MSMFVDGQAADLSLSDEALFGAEDEAPEATEERQESEQPQTEVTEEGPAQEQTSPEPETEVATPEEPAEEPATEETKEQPAPDWQKQVQEATARMTRACQEAAEAKRAAAALQARLEQLTQAPTQAQPLDPQAKEQFLQQLVENPHQALAQFAQEQTGTLVQQQVKQLLQPVLQAVTQQTQERDWVNAVHEQTQHWPQLQQQESMAQTVERMARMSADLGDPDLWKKQPAKMLQMAAIDLFGLPKTVDSEAVRAANEAGRKAALSERQAKETAKAGLAAGMGAAKNTPAALSEDDELIKGIENARGGKLI